jgi:hypothetical protein
MYSLGDEAKNVTSSIIHIEGDPDHPVNRGTLCPKGAGLLDFVHSPSRLKYPEVREPGSSEWKRVSWDEAMSRIAKLMKADRDANFIARNDDGQLVNRCLSTGMLCASASSNETGYVTHALRTRYEGNVQSDAKNWSDGQEISGRLAQLENSLRTSHALLAMVLALTRKKATAGEVTDLVVACRSSAIPSDVLAAIAPQLAEELSRLQVAT